jgi:diacylglycerol kinase family enzyme
MTDIDGATQASRLTPHVALRRVEVVVNPLSGGVGPKAAAECEALLADFDLEANVVAAEPNQIQAALEAAIAAKPDALIILAGDGTARSAAAMAGPKGPLIAPLPGGTMNMLPRALYGTADWKKALVLALTEGCARPVSGGEVDGNPFYCAAILGSPALWAPAREAVRTGKVRLAWLYARRALRRSFSGRVRFRLDDGSFHRGEALSLMSPLISKTMTEPVGLEAAVLNLNNAAEAFRLGATAVFRDWRDDPSVDVRPVKSVIATARRPIPGILDGETVQLDRRVRVRFVPVAFQALAPKLTPSGEGA